jgi:hypothetical protein
VRTKYAKTLVWVYEAVYVLEKLSDVSGLGLEEARRYNYNACPSQTLHSSNLSPILSSIAS